MNPCTNCGSLRHRTTRCPYPTTPEPTINGAVSYGFGPNAGPDISTTDCGGSADCSF